MNTNPWEALGQFARQISAPAGDPEATAFLNLFRLLVMLEGIRKQEANSTDLSSAKVLIEFKDTGPLPSVINFSVATEIGATLEAAFRHNEEWNKNHPEAQFPLFGFTPELRAWALQQLSKEEDIAADLQELRQKGGPELSEVLQQLEQELAQP